MIPLGAVLHSGPDGRIEQRWVIATKPHPTDHRGQIWITCSTAELRVKQKTAEIMARPVRHLPPGPAKDALRAFARALGRAAAQDRFGPTSPSTRRTTRGHLR